MTFLLAAPIVSFGLGWAVRGLKARSVAWERDLAQWAAETRMRASERLVSDVALLKRSRRRLIDNPDLAYKLHYRARARIAT